MPENWQRLRARASDAVAVLNDLLADDDADDRRLILGYLEAKRALASAFESFAVEKYSDPSVIDQAKRAIEAEMARRYGTLPVKYLRIRGYGESHARLLAYLTNRVGTEVASDELRMLTGDAVHTERRARELRDLGFKLDAAHTGGVDVYVLVSATPHVAHASKYLVRKNIKEDKSLTATDIAELLRTVGLEA